MPAKHVKKLTKRAEPGLGDRILQWVNAKFKKATPPPKRRMAD